ncbi:GNAT family N-acetyltransferase [Almyronema epifaneia]|uniref:GNAT family N-acetyltransferase n=1 Tax=Almyronema epifaneia S1 TaxID=2991925 RepID=A0ABW6ICT8_9CYAN
MIAVKVIAIDDDLQKLVEDINNASWDDANEMSQFNVEELSTYLNSQDTIFVACYDIVDSNKILLGIASARLEIKPYKKMRWLYVDEVDVCANQRKKGAGKAIMRKLIEIANDTGCEEVWLGTEVDNQAANALYQALEPDNVAQFVGYTYATD